MTFIPDMNKMVLVEKSSIVVIRNETGKTISFSTLDECLKMTGFDFTGKGYIDYEPDRFLHIDTASDISEMSEESFSGEVAEYEALILRVDEFVANMINPFYGKTVSESKVIKVNELKRQAMQIITTKWAEYKQRNASLGLLSQVDIDQMKLDITTVRDVCDAAENEVESKTTVSTIENVTVNWPTI